MADSEGEPAQGETALDRFRELARKLVQVPKREIYEEQAKEDERKEVNWPRERHSFGSTPRK
jgi:hypothetical protein